MKFKDIKEGTKFKNYKYENQTFKKVREVRGNCCRKSYNAVNELNNNQVLFTREDEVEIVE